MSSGCGCKVVYRFPHITSPLLLLYLLFAAASYFLFIFECFSFLFQYIFVNNLIIFTHSINKHKSDYGRPTKAV